MYLGAVILGGYDEILLALSSVPYDILILIFALSLVNYFIRFIRWDWYIRKFDFHLPYWRHCCYYLAGFTLTTTPGKAGEAIRSLYLKQHGVDYSHSLAALFAERFLDLMTLIIMASLLTLAIQDYGWLLFTLSCISIGLLVAIQSPRVINILRRFFNNVLSEKLIVVADHFMYLIHNSAKLLRNRNLIAGLLLGLLAWIAEGIGFYLIVNYLGVQSDYSTCIGIYAIAMLVGAVSFLPGGLGSAEFTMGALLVAVVGTSPTLAISATLLCRIATLWFAVLLGMLSMAGLEISGYFTTSQVVDKK
jgi:uncharacterized protein (TIRG00374 family)